MPSDYIYDEIEDDALFEVSYENQKDTRRYYYNLESLDVECVNIEYKYYFLHFIIKVLITISIILSISTYKLYPVRKITKVFIAICTIIGLIISFSFTYI